LKSKVGPKKKEREGTSVTFPNQKKKWNLTKKIKPPTHLAMLKSRLKSKTIPKKKRKRENVSNVPKLKKNKK
jgi:hypothetical protein